MTVSGYRLRLRQLQLRRRPISLQSQWRNVPEWPSNPSKLDYRERSAAYIWNSSARSRKKARSPFASVTWGELRHMARRYPAAQPPMIMISFVYAKADAVVASIVLAPK
jgi:hypothetical protein